MIAAAALPEHPHPNFHSAATVAKDAPTLSSTAALLTLGPSELRVRSAPEVLRFAALSSVFTIAHRRAKIAFPEQWQYLRVADADARWAGVYLARTAWMAPSPAAKMRGAGMSRPCQAITKVRATGKMVRFDALPCSALLCGGSMMGLLLIIDVERCWLVE